MMVWTKVKMAAVVVVGVALVVGVAAAGVAGTASTLPSVATSSAMSGGPTSTRAQPQTDSRSAVPLLAEIEAIASGWEENAAKIRSFTVTGSFTVSSEEYAAFKDYDGKSYPGHTARFEIAKDGRNLRIETVFDRLFNTQTGRVEYRIPYGKYVLANPTQEQLAQLYRDKGTTVATDRVLLLENQTHRYSKESNQVYVEHPRPYVSFAERELRWLVNLSPLSPDGLRQYLQGRLRAKIAISVEKHTGEQCVLRCRRMEKTEQGAEESVPTETLITLNVSHAYAIESIQTSRAGEVIGEGTYEYVERGGAWVLSAGRSRERVAGQGKWSRAAELHVDLNSLQVNAPIDRTVFTVEALGIAKGARVMNVITGEESIYGVSR